MIGNARHRASKKTRSLKIKQVPDCSPAMSDRLSLLVVTLGLSFFIVGDGGRPA